MNRTEQMVMGFQSHMAKLNPISPCVHSCKPSLPAIGECQILRESSFQCLDRTPRSHLRRWDVHRLLEIACRAVVDCSAMVVCVLFAALATLLFGL